VLVGGDLVGGDTDVAIGLLIAQPPDRVNVVLSGGPQHAPTVLTPSTQRTFV
jgi:hypothetical protein